ncbi:MAG: glycosyltransferase family 2 protein [Candidatus Levybacteria bacterium]|nr:glycosyltransferase family 2 protein [Candidatus Levybacteria bacterium]
MSKLSVVVSAFNEERKIKDCLESVKWADEIILINSSSTDKTVEIAKKYTKKIFTQPNHKMLNINKNFGFDNATGDWILNLDSDERVSPELEKEIELRIKNNELGINGYWIPRKNILFGKWIRHAGWYPDHQLRLFRKDKGRFPEKHVHEKIAVDGETAYLKEHLSHLNYETIDQFLKKLSAIYTLNEAEELIKKGYVFDWKDAIRMPAGEFISRFFAREGYKDGFHGLMISLLMAFYHLIVFANIWEKQGFMETEGNIIEEAEKEFKKSNKEITYWFFNEKIKTSKNLLRKTSLKLQRKFSK